MKYLKYSLLLLILIPIFSLSSCFGLDDEAYEATDEVTRSSITYDIYYTTSTDTYTAKVYSYDGSDSTLEIPDTITYDDEDIDVIEIMTQACVANSNIETVIIGDNVTEVGFSAFANCQNLTSVTFGSSVVEIDSYAFYDSGLTSVTIPEQVTNIYKFCFKEDDALESVVLLSTSVSISKYAFEDVDSINEVYFYGTSDEFASLDIADDNDGLTDSNIYYYSESEPTDDGLYWYYVDGVITVW